MPFLLGDQRASFSTASWMTPESKQLSSLLGDQYFVSAAPFPSHSCLASLHEVQIDQLSDLSHILHDWPGKTAAAIQALPPPCSRMLREAFLSLSHSPQDLCTRDSCLLLCVHSHFYGGSLSMGPGTGWVPVFCALVGRRCLPAWQCASAPVILCSPVWFSDLHSLHCASSV